MATKSYDIKADFGAIGNGVADDAPAFYNFLAAALNWQTANPNDDFLLNVPAGTYLFASHNAQSSFVFGLKQVVVAGAGTSSTTFTGATLFHLAGFGQYQDGSHSARTATAVAGQNFVDLINPAQASLFTVGNYALMTGFDLQSFWSLDYGFPSNQHFFEYCLVTSIVGGRVTFSAALRNTYKSTWPVYSHTSGSDNGGPATLYAWHPEWNTQTEYRNLTIAINNQMSASGRNIILRNINFTGTGTNVCIVPSSSQSWSFIGGSHGTTIEADKLVTQVTLSGGCNVHGITFQSSSIDLFVADNANIPAGVVGTPKETQIVNNSNIGLLVLGATNYGRSDAATISDSVISSFGSATYHSDFGTQDNGSDYYGSKSVGIENVWSMVGGVIKVPNGATISAVADNGAGLIRATVDNANGFTSGKYVQIIGMNYNTNVAWTALNNIWPLTVIDATHVDLVGSTSTELTGKTYVANSGTFQGGGFGARWAVPGTYLFWGDDNFTFPGFSVLDVTQDANATYIQTDQTGTFPPHTGKLWFRTHASPQLTVRNCGGCPEIVDMSQAPAGAPLFSYMRRPLDGSTPVGPYWPVYGYLSKVTIAVNTPFTGTGAAALTLPLSSAFYLQTNLTTQAWNPSVNLQVAGTRVIGSGSMIGSAAWSGGQSGDTLPAITQPLWATANYRLTTTDISTQPSATWPTGFIEIITDQRLPAAPPSPSPPQNTGNNFTNPSIVSRRMPWTRK